MKVKRVAATSAGGLRGLINRRGFAAALSAAVVLGAGASAHAPTVFYSGTGHWYEIVNSPNTTTWTGASTAATSLGGYLATITSAGENAFVAGLLGTDSQSRAWLGGSDEGHEGVWNWVVGDEAGSTFYTTGTGTQPGFYSNWSAIGGEPNNFGGAENYAEMFGGNNLESGNGTWNDLPVTGTPGISAVVEFDRVAAAVPEPGVWAMMIFGIAILGASLRLHAKQDRRLEHLRTEVV